jgi:ribosomal subunit interface protein
MNISIESVNVQVPEELRQMINQKFMHLMKQYDRIRDCLVIIHRQQVNDEKVYILEASLMMPRFSLVSRQQGNTIEIALKKLIQDLSRQLRRYLLSREEIW